MALWHTLVLIICLTACITRPLVKADIQLPDDNSVAGNEDIENFQINKNDTIRVQAEDSLDEFDHQGPLQGSLKGDQDGLDPFGHPRNSDLRIPWWSNLLNTIIQTFYTQRQNDRSQFGVLYMANVDNLHRFKPMFLPQRHDGSPVIDNRYAYSPSNADMENFICSRPEFVPYLKRMVHSEEQMLNRIKILWNAYLDRFNKKPNMILLYSWIMPCPACTKLIIKTLTKPPYRSVRLRIVGYTVDGTKTLRYMTKKGNRESEKLLRNADIDVYKKPCLRPYEMRLGVEDEPNLEEAVEKDKMTDNVNVEKSVALSMENASLRDGVSDDWSSYTDVSDTNSIGSEESNGMSDADAHTCTMQDTLQGCMVDCIADICCSCKTTGKKPMAIALVNNIAKACATSDITTCTGSWVRKYLDAITQRKASGCITTKAATQQVHQCSVKCVGKPLSKLMDPNRPNQYPGYLTKLSELSNLPKVDLTDYCDDMRTGGLLCTVYRADSYTAGNTLCQTGNRCERHGYPFEWCYTYANTEWDYCCSGPCGFHGGTSYEWCKSGNQWQYCGNAGDVTIKDQHCVSRYPCGVHQAVKKTAYFWCYTDYGLNTWNYCCQPGHHCDKHGYSFNWCWTGVKKDTHWKRCTPP